MEKLSDYFLLELFKSCFSNKTICQICVKNLKFEYLPTEDYKIIWKRIKFYFIQNNQNPSFGVIAQMEREYGKAYERRMALMEKIKEIPTPKEEDILRQLEEYIKDAIAVDFYDKFAELYGQGKTKEAQLLMRRVGEEINDFSLLSNFSFEKVFGGFKNRIFERRIKKLLGHVQAEVVGFGIDELDEYCKGMDIGDTACILARSGVGKTKALRHVGVYYARRGMKVLHIQLEGTKYKALIGYDSTWSARKGYEFEDEEALSDDEVQNLVGICSRLNSFGGEIFVESYEKFTRPTLVEIIGMIRDFILKMGYSPDLIIVDYLELLDPGNGVRYSLSEERHRRLAIAEGLKNIAVTFKTRVLTATQANDVSKALLDDPEFVLTRHNVSEAKSLPNPFSFFFTLNQTSTEYEENLMRIFLDKVRDHKGGQTVTIAQNYDSDRFYDRRRTLKEILSGDEG